MFKPIAAMPLTKLPEYGQSMGAVVQAYEDGDVGALQKALDEADPVELNSQGPANIFIEPEGHKMDDDDDDYAVLPHHVYFEAHEVLDDYLPGCLPTSLLSCATWVTGNIFRGATNRLKENDHPFLKHSKKRLLALYNVLVNHPKVDVNAVLSKEEYFSIFEDPTVPQNNTDQELFMMYKHHDRMTAFDYAWRAAAFATTSYPQALMLLLIRSGKQDMAHKPVVYDDTDESRYTCSSIVHMAAYNNFDTVFSLALWNDRFPVKLIQSFADMITDDMIERSPSLKQWLKAANKRLAVV